MNPRIYLRIRVNIFHRRKPQISQMGTDGGRPLVPMFDMGTHLLWKLNFVHFSCRPDIVPAMKIRRRI